MRWDNDWILYKWDRKPIILHIRSHKQEREINVPITYFINTLTKKKQTRELSSLFLNTLKSC